MRTISAKDAKYNFGELIDTARAGPVTVVKYGRPVVVVMAVEEYKRLKGLDATDPPPTSRTKKLPLPVERQAPAPRRGAGRRGH